MNPQLSKAWTSGATSLKSRGWRAAGAQLEARGWWLNTGRLTPGSLDAPVTPATQVLSGCLSTQAQLESRVGGRGVRRSVPSKAAGCPFTAAQSRAPPPPGSLHHHHHPRPHPVFTSLLFCFVVAHKLHFPFPRGLALGHSFSQGLAPGLEEANKALGTGRGAGPIPPCPS